MIKFYSDTSITHVDVPGKISLMVYSLGCNLNCYDCHSHNLIKKQQKFIGADEVLNKIKNVADIVDCVVFSGGEFLNNDYLEVFNFLKEVREIYFGNVIINSNGTKGDALQGLFIQRLIDGCFLDVKIAPDISKEKQNTILGVNNANTYQDSIRKSIVTTQINNKELSQFRTVHYPLYTEEDLNIIEEYIAYNVAPLLEKREGLEKVPWVINDFFYSDNNNMGNDYTNENTRECD